MEQGRKKRRRRNSVNILPCLARLSRAEDKKGPEHAHLPLFPSVAGRRRHLHPISSGPGLWGHAPQRGAPSRPAQCTRCAEVLAAVQCCSGVQRCRGCCGAAVRCNHRAFSGRRVAPIPPNHPLRRVCSGHWGFGSRARDSAILSQSRGQSSKVPQTAQAATVSGRSATLALKISPGPPPLSGPGTRRDGSPALFRSSVDP